MNEKKIIKISKYLSLILRHKPEVIGLELDNQAWALTDELLQKLNNKGTNLSFDELKEVVLRDNKKRYIFSSDFKKIRANQGHSIPVELDLKETKPPEFLYHGTAERNMHSVKEKGLIKGKRHHVHLSSDIDTALNVGKRYGKPVILKIKAGDMHKAGLVFYLSENDVWLTEYVSPDFILFEQ